VEHVAEQGVDATAGRQVALHGALGDHDNPSM
jgi:hypothetical protein